MPIKKIRKNEYITSDVINKIIDGYNKTEELLEKTEAALANAERQNRENQSIIDSFIQRFSDKIESQPTVFNALDIYKHLSNGMVESTQGASNNPIPFSVFYGTMAEIQAREFKTGQVLIEENGTIFFDIVKSSGETQRVQVSQANPITSIRISTTTSNWELYDGNDWVDTGVSAEGVGSQGPSGPIGRPGPAIKLVSTEEKPKEINGVDATKIAQDTFMSTAYVYNRKIYAPYLEGDDVNGYVGKYKEVANFNVELELLDSNGKRYGEDGASINPDDYTFYIKRGDVLENTGVKARGPIGMKGDSGDTWFMHIFYSHEPLIVGENEITFFNNLSTVNIDASYIVVVASCAKEEGYPVFKEVPSSSTISKYYNSGDPATFAMYWFSIKPNVLVPYLTESKDGLGYDLSWKYETDISINSLPTTVIKHGRNIEPIGRFESKATALVEAKENKRLYATYIIPSNINDIDDGSDYLYMFANEKLTYLGRLTGIQGLPGTKGETGDTGKVGPSGPTGPRGSQYFYLNTSLTLEDDRKAPVGSFNSFVGATIQAGDIAIDKNGKIAIITTIESQTAYYDVFASIKGDTSTIEIGSVIQLPYGSLPRVVNTGTKNDAILRFELPSGEKGERGEKGDPGVKGEKGDPNPSIQPTVLPDRYAAPGNDYFNKWVIVPGKKDEEGKVGLPEVWFGATEAKWIEMGKIGEAGAKGETGAKGDTGDIGPEGPSIKLMQDGSEIKWKVDKDSEDWKTLLPLSAITGAQGPQGPSVKIIKEGTELKWEVNKGQSESGTITSISEISGKNGKDGTNGWTLMETHSYGISTESTSKPGSYGTIESALNSFNATNRFLWRKTVSKWEGGSGTEPTTGEGTIEIIIGTHGVNGKDGAAGKGITNIKLYWAISNSSAPNMAGLPWQSTVSEDWGPNIRYLFKKTEYTYSSGNPTTTYELVSVYNIGAEFKVSDGVLTIKPK